MMIDHHGCIIYMDLFKPDNENYYDVTLLYKVVRSQCVIYGDLTFGWAVDKFFQKVTVTLFHVVLRGVIVVGDPS